MDSFAYFIQRAEKMRKDYEHLVNYLEVPILFFLDQILIRSLTLSYLNLRRSGAKQFATGGGLTLYC